jgi:hypothetical protein
MTEITRLKLDQPINIISRIYAKGKTGGPFKVAANTIKGLRRIDQPFEINRPAFNYKYNWVHDDPLRFIDLTTRGIPFLAGPNIFALPKNFPLFSRGNPGSIYLHPSEWTINFWEYFNYKGCTLKKWAAGIDTDEYCPPSSKRGNDVLLYFKKRHPSILDQAIALIQSLGYKTQIIRYGYYSESDFKNALSQCSFGVWIGTTESQGIALLEALSTDLPLVVLDSKNILDNNADEIADMPSGVRGFSATTAPYFNDLCGILINDLEKLGDAIVTMQNSPGSYSPRGYILDNFTLEKCAWDLVWLFQELNFHSHDSSKGEAMLTAAKTGLYKSIYNVQKYYRIARRKTINAFKKPLP